MLKSVAFAAAVTSATAFAPAAVGPATRGNTAVCANKFGQQAPAGAPAADLFNIWRDDYMVFFMCMSPFILRDHFVERMLPCLGAICHMLSVS